MLNHILLVAFIAFYGICSGTATALEISPLKLTIDAQKGVGTFQLSNSKDVRVLFDAKVFRWVDSADFSSVEETDEILVVPPIFELEPNEVQTIRVALRNAAQYDTEQTFRLLTTEVPSEIVSDKGIAFQFRMNTPIFVTPPGAKPNPIWQIKPIADETIRLTLTNQGNAHLHIGSLSLVSAGDGEQLLNTESGSYIFGGEQHSWIVHSSLQAMKGPFIVKAATNEGAIEETIAPSDS